MFVALAPIAAAAAVLVAATLPSRAPAPVVATLQPGTKPAPAPVQARAAQGDLLEPRGSARAPRVKTVSLRGQNVDVGTGALEGAKADGPTQPFVLRRTDVRADVTGFVSQVTVTQEFENPFSSPVEAIYVFPLPEDAAVDEMTLVAGTRVIRAKIQKRDDARRSYEQAKAEGRRAALLDQERPNLFTQSIANLLPGEPIKVSLRYVAPLGYDDGLYTFNFPMTVGPRFVPGTIEDAARLGTPTERSGRDITVAVHLFAGAQVEELTSVSHRLRVVRGDGAQDVTLDPADRVPNRDFILRWRVAGPAMRAAVLSTGGAGGTFALMVMPQAREAHVAPVPKELVFVIDTSCSMAGAPLDAAKRAMRSALEQLNPDDTFMLIDFADRASSFHDTPLPNTPANVGRAIAYLGGLPASGGTNQLAGLMRALRLPRDDGRLREVLLMTDGFIGNESEIFAAAEQNLGAARVFGFGVGNSVNHYLLSRLSQVGRGFYQYVRTDEDPEAAVERFVRRIERPLLTDLTVDWAGVEVLDVLPRKVPDLFDAQPVVLVGRYRQPGHGTVTLRGLRNGVAEELKVAFELPRDAGAAPGLSSLWARARIEELDMMQHGAELTEIATQIQVLGLEHKLVTRYTSFVAVDSERVTAPSFRVMNVANEPVDGTRAAKGKVATGLFEAPTPAGPVTGDDEFAAAFGGQTRPPPVEQPPPKKTVYVPPPPGALGQADIMEVVKANIHDIKRCVDRQRAKDPSVHGKLVMKWVVRTDGTVSLVEVESIELANTEVATCLTELIKTWRFPQTLTPRSEPVLFPFKF
ncbi:MAG: AgmX/PglI C-terminal domain-containing protein [Myxococcaceae bacterium]|nr:AgmX/PglI C-terminal domain-containing protein [Myxococcaceae bacterium]